MRDDVRLAVRDDVGLAVRDDVRLAVSDGDNVGLEVASEAVGDFDLEFSGALETPNENCIDGPDTETSEMAIVDADPSLA